MRFFKEVLKYLHFGRKQIHEKNNNYHHVTGYDALFTFGANNG